MPDQPGTGGSEDKVVCEECRHGEHEVCALSVWVDQPDGASVPCACDHREHGGATV
jgi:hypothetical protein